MRIRFFVLGVSASCVLAALAMQACGGDSTTTEPVDSGADVVADTGPRDTGVVDTGVDTGPPCDLSGSLTDGIPDASLADGATTSGVCLGCLDTKCNTEVTQCSGDCNCREVVSSVLDCYTKGGSLQSCLFSSKVTPSNKTQQIGLAIVGCIQSDCKTECAVDKLFPDAGDAGDGGDGG